MEPEANEVREEENVRRDFLGIIEGSGVLMETHLHNKNEWRPGHMTWSQSWKGGRLAVLRVPV